MLLSRSLVTKAVKTEAGSRRLLLACFVEKFTLATMHCSMVMEASLE